MTPPKSPAQHTSPTPTPAPLSVSPSSVSPSAQLTTNTPSALKVVASQTLYQVVLDSGNIDGYNGDSSSSSDDVNEGDKRKRERSSTPQVSPDFVTSRRQEKDN